MYCSSHLFPIHIIYVLIFPIIRAPVPRYKWVGKSLTCNKQVGFKALCNKQVGFKALVISKSFSSLLIGCVRRPTPRTDKESSSITDKVCQLLATGRWFSPGPPASSTNRTDRHDIAEILLNTCIFNEVQ
jgi:hypothetical protein